MSLGVEIYTGCSKCPHVSSQIRHFMHKPLQTEWESFFFPSRRPRPSPFWRGILQVPSYALPLWKSGTGHHVGRGCQGICSHHIDSYVISSLHRGSAMWQCLIWEYIVMVHMSWWHFTMAAKNGHLISTMGWGLGNIARGKMAGTLTQCGLVMTYDSIDLGQHWLR